ncbi:MAG: hypothetical protein NTV70_24965 [Acidobacteria bacterium]|nr:hypothetical protein [Acidobacteriota bacterium]
MSTVYTSLAGLTGRLVSLTALALIGAGSMLGFSSGPPAQRTGAAADGGINCTACHRGALANADQRGRIAIDAASYRPGVRQTVRVTVEHPDALRWGFQLIARYASGESRQAGSFTPNAQTRVVCGATATPFPCNGDREFASHTAAATVLGSNGRMVFEVEWTPPSEDVGDVTFYAAGNAANNGGGNTGDMIYTTATVVRNGAGCALETPTIREVSNSASGAPNMAFNGLTSIYGANFSPTGRARSATEAEVRLLAFPKQMDCVTVLVNGRPAPITYAGSGQINFQAPFDQLNAATVQVVANRGLPNERASAAFSSIISPLQPALFTFSGTRSVAARGPDGATPVAQPSVVTGGRPAKPGDMISIFATGLGITNPAWDSGDIARNASPLQIPISVEVGGITVPATDIMYQGAAVQAISGLYQVNVKLPMSLGAGDQSLVIRQGGLASQAGVTVPIVP